MNVLNNKYITIIVLSLATTSGVAIGLAISHARSSDIKITLVSVYDGDTFKVNIDGYPDIVGNHILIRIRGIDTPELKDKEHKSLALRARDFSKKKLESAKEIKLLNMERDKYFRIVADVYVDGENLANMLLIENLANKYDGNSKTEW